LGEAAAGQILTLH